MCEFPEPMIFVLSKLESVEGQNYLVSEQNRSESRETRVWKYTCKSFPRQRERKAVLWADRNFLPKMETPINSVGYLNWSVRLMDGLMSFEQWRCLPHLAVSIRHFAVAWIVWGMLQRRVQSSVRFVSGGRWELCKTTDYTVYAIKFWGVAGKWIWASKPRRQ